MSILKHQETKRYGSEQAIYENWRWVAGDATGKINLSLLVAGKRPDGYHELETIMAKINWYDEILIEQKAENRKQKTEGGGRKNVQYPISNDKCRSETDIELICKGPYKVPEGEDNLVYKAAKAILEKAKRKSKKEKIR